MHYYHNTATSRKCENLIADSLWFAHILSGYSIGNRFTEAFPEDAIPQEVVLQNVDPIDGYSPCEYSMGFYSIRGSSEGGLTVSTA